MENEEKHRNDVHSVRLKAGKRRTYFFDVKSTKNNDFFLTITESKKLPNDDYERHKIFIYKEDFVKFVNTLQETVDYIKTELLPDYDFDNPNEERDYNSSSNNEKY
ncbi:MAG: PUR family DNA/RNA-binding protein [Chitinophagales bacterium]|nr:PUR family DNA/RNA-binding protein [Chitinophagales bacterium]